MEIINTLLNFLLGECIIKNKFHIYCPGCGGTRAIIALLKFDIIKSFKYNPIIIMLCLYILINILLNNIERKNNKIYLKVRFCLILSFFTIWFLHFVIRNFLLLFMHVDLLGDFVNL